jgi:DNA-binding transcriptional LysR family regulator
MPLAEPVPDLLSLDLLRSVGGLGSIRRASQAHGMSQPAASMRLRTLERTLGLELLDRTSGRAQLTPTGRAVVQWSESVFSAMSALLLGTAALRTGGRIQLRLAASMTVAEYLVPMWLERLRIANPSLRVSLEMGNSAQVAEWVSGGKVDVGFVEGLEDLRGLENVEVETDNLVLVVSPSHPWAGRVRPVPGPELASEPLVMREVGSGTREVLERALDSSGLAATPLAELGSTTAIKAAVAGGLGPAVLSRLAVRVEVADGRLIEVATVNLDLRRSIRAVWSGRRQLGGPAKQLLTCAGASAER